MLIKSVLDFYNVELKEHPAANAIGIPDDKKALFNAIASLIDLPEDGRFFFETKPVVECLLIAYADQTSQPVDWAQIDSIYNLKSSQLILDVMIKRLWGIKGKHPLFSFLILSASGDESLSMLVRNSRYIALVPYLIQRMRYLQGHVLFADNDYLSNLALAARKVVVGAPPLRPHSTFSWSYKTLVAIAAKALKFIVGVNTELGSKGDATYIMDLFFRERARLERRTGAGKGEREERWLLLERSLRSTEVQFDFEMNDEDDAFVPSESGKASLHIIANPEYERVKNELPTVGEFPVDYEEQQILELPANWFVDPWAAKRRERGKVESIVATQRIMPWDKACLSRASVYAILSLLESNPGKWKAVLGLSLLLGMSEKKHKSLRIGEFHSDNKSSEITRKKLKGERFFNPVDGTLWWTNPMGTADGDKYLSQDLIVEMKLPEVILRQFAMPLKDGERAFTSEDISKAKWFLSNMAGDGVNDVSLKRLNATFEAYFLSGAGLPELFADHLQSRQRIYLGSQHYYVTLDWSHMIDVWHRMVAKFISGIMEGSSVSEVIAEMSKQGSESSQQSLREPVYIGANGTPRSHSLRDHFSWLRSQFPSTSKDLIYCSANQWNAYMAYLYGLYAVATGNRPQRDPMPQMSSMNIEEGWSYIDDKHNRMFKESRVVPLCRTLRESLQIHSKIHPEWLMARRTSGYSLDGPSDSFFLIDEDHRMLVPVSPSACDRLIIHDNNSDSAYFEGLGNGFRHYLLTTLLKAGLPQLLIDFVSGHRHMGMEPEFNGSPVSWRESANSLAMAIEEHVVGPLGLVVALSA